MSAASIRSGRATSPRGSLRRARTLPGQLHRTPPVFQGCRRIDGHRASSVMSPKWIGMRRLQACRRSSRREYSGSSCTRIATRLRHRPLTTWARSHGKRVIVDARDAARLSDDVAVEPVSATELADQADALISLGGDGTMLGALRLVAQRPVPVLGVNLGNLGFLVEVEPNELDAALDRLERGDYSIEEHSGAVLTDGRDESVAFNDIALASVPGEGSVQALLSVNGRPSGRYRCDALVIAMPIRFDRLFVRRRWAARVTDARRHDHQPGRTDIWYLSTGGGLGRRADRVGTDGKQRPTGSLKVDGTIARRMRPGEALEVRLQTPGGPPGAAGPLRATSAAAGSSSACSTYPSYPRRCATCSQARRP